VAAGAAHVYTECARIFNPIHTDRAVALGAGLPDIILHGTATMAMAVSRIVDGYLGGDGRRVRRLGGRFAAMVLMPSTLELVVTAAEDDAVFFHVLTENGQRAFDRAYVCFD
jgi:acyl dehydratase